MAKIIVAEDDPNMVSVLSEVLRDQRHEILCANTAETAFEQVQAESPDLVLVDIEMPEGKPTGLELLRQIKEFNISIPVVMITGNVSIERAVQALRDGAHDFVQKPFRIDELVKRVENALFQQKAVHALAENAELKTLIRDKFSFENIIGHSGKMEAVFRMIRRVANTDSTVLILGESGTGKELVAKALHCNSRRGSMPFVAVNCSALPEHLLESELFGHRKGAFTGAAFDKLGLFQHADGGTIFLDEIGSMAPGLQSKLLRFLQDKELRRVGDTSTIHVDVRVLAATNEPLQEKIKAKTFREDLFYRISVIPIELPPLRDRQEDIPLLVNHFVQTISSRYAAQPPQIPADVMAALVAYQWPGNVRELQNAMERACALHDNGVIELKDLPERAQRSGGVVAAPPVATEDYETFGTRGRQTTNRIPESAMISDDGSLIMLKDFLHQQELIYIERAIEAAGGSKEKAAQTLGISMATLYRKLNPSAALSRVEVLD